MTTQEKLKAIQERHEREISNPKIHKNDHLYHNEMVLIVEEKTNWHLYYDPIYGGVFSIAVVPSAKSSCFGNVRYFKRWYNYRKRMNDDIDDCITNKGFELLDK